MKHVRRTLLAAPACLTLLGATASLQAAGVVAKADAPPPSSAAMRAATTARDAYLLQPGDLLTIMVWREKELQSDVLVRPDGGLSFPLVGDLVAKGKSADQVRLEIMERLKPYFPDPVVTVAVKLTGGNRIYVIGNVNRPGDYALNTQLDVMQALSLAGGATTYAALNDIVILRRDNGVQGAIRFRYGDIARGKELSQNILLQSGDTVVVP